MTRNFGLDVIRCFAILFVCLAHICFNVFDVGSEKIWYVGFFGVELFFVLSGFLIGQLIIDSCDIKNEILPTKKLSNFIFRRWLRTLPLYYLFLLLNFLFYFFCLNTTKDINLSFLFFTQSFISKAAFFFGESWSLCVEEWFYLLFPFGLLVFLNAVQRLKIVFKKKVFLYIGLFILLISMLRYIFFRNENDMYCITASRLDAIAYGVMAVFFKEKFSKKLSLLLLFIFSVFLVLGSVYLFLNSYRHQYDVLYYNFIGIALSGIIIIFYSIPFTLVPTIFKKSIQFISKISYSIYLNNLFIIHFYMHYFKNFSTNFINSIIVVALIILTSTLTYYFIELPFLRYRDKKFPK